VSPPGVSEPINKRELLAENKADQIMQKTRGQFLFSSGGAVDRGKAPSGGQGEKLLTGKFH